MLGSWWIRKKLGRKNTSRRTTRKRSWRDGETLETRDRQFQDEDIYDTM
jgi:hypothetical protein